MSNTPWTSATASPDESQSNWALTEIAGLGEQALAIVGARAHDPTPIGVTELEACLREARTPAEIRMVKQQAGGVLERIDGVLLRDAHEKIGTLTGALVQAYSLPPQGEIFF
ncbi:hypothetical protein OM076_42840 [Solirubrobacter ginsenosidimutans]|uniref:Uncharacterized protein n=1 Tax=Solirubrobacter ginsenosidimutans TaxID=490573 RepID=A0A9X3N4X0_9ACTN|nr:hypothetical protein [Solirubrobacter ginsenosidimutans]MDA0167075.1 hypothetical protein [Solirubrobacter ginsenosidimutans]